MKALGIDIGFHSVKCVELSQQKDSFQVTRVFEHLLNLNPAHDSALEVLEFLQGLRSSLDFDKTQIVLALPQRDLSSRRLKFPFTDRLKIAQSLPFELEDEIPLNVEDALFESRIIRQSRSQAEVFAMAVLRPKVQDLFKLGQDV
ncbi:MAG: pilus assembly protein PilM, partial [Bdellovibrio sp.]